MTTTTTTTTEKQVLSNNIVLTDSLLLTQASSEKILETSLGICKHKMRKVNLKSQNQMHTEGYLNIRDKESKKKQKKQQKKLDYAYCFDMCIMTVGKEQCPMPNFWSTISLIFSVESHSIFSELMALMGLTVVKFAVYSDPVFIKHKLPSIVPDSCAFCYPT